MELGPQNHNGDGFLRPNSIIVVYMDPLGHKVREDVADNALLGDRNFTRRPDVETDVAKLNQALDGSTTLKYNP